jgi:glycine hydroxymethyltransferase
MIKTLSSTDPEIDKILKEEERRQKETIALIPSENYASTAVRAALGSVLTNKYSEGYPKKRYYQGNKNADNAEILAIERAKKLFKVEHVNVQPYSGSPANLAILVALCKVGDTIMGHALPDGGHLTHGWKASVTGKFFNGIQYHLDEKGYINLEEVKKLAKQHKPKVIFIGATAYSRTLPFAEFAEIAEKNKAYLVADISHVAGLIAGGAHPSPALFADVIMTTTHKTLRGPRGAMIMVTKKGLRKDKDLADKIDSAVFPGLQGGPHDDQTAAIAVALKEADSESFKKYAKQIVANAKTLGKELTNYGFDIVSGGTDNHLLLIDLRGKKINGALAAYALEHVNIITNKNSVPNDTNPPFYPSGLRIGTPAITTRGMKESDMKKIASWINQTVVACGEWGLPGSKEKRNVFFKAFKDDINHNKELEKIAAEVKKFASKFPLP